VTQTFGFVTAKSPALRSGISLTYTRGVEWVFVTLRITVAPNMAPAWSSQFAWISFKRFIDCAVFGFYAHAGRVSDKERVRASLDACRRLVAASGEARMGNKKRAAVRQPGELRRGNFTRG